MAKLILKDIPDSLMSLVRWINDDGNVSTFYLPKPIVDIMKANLTIQDLQAYKVRNNPEQSFTV